MRQTRIAQMPPMGADPMGGLGGGMGAPPPQPPAPQKPAITGPLDSVGELLYDYNVEEFIALHPGKTDENMAADIWTAYGGTEDGGIDPTHIGERTDESINKTPEEIQKEIEATDSEKWKRLPAGKTVADITTFDEIIALLKSLTYGTIKKFRQPAAPPGGGMPPMAASHNRMEKTALVEEFMQDFKKLGKIK